MRTRKTRWGRKIFLILLLIVFILGLRYVYKVKEQINEINNWKSTVEEAANNHDIGEYSDIVMAIILTETKGNHVDLMQSSESKYGSQNQITSSEESIQSGVAHLSQVIQLSKESGTDVWTGVQAYNFGSNYIAYVKDNGGRTSVELAERYSKENLAPALGNTTGKTYRYLHPKALFFNGGYLYENGGNFFYTEIVQLNLAIMKSVNQLPF